MARALVLALAALPALVQGKITVHVVPHTHDDVGWLKTVDEYFTGQNNSIQHAYVQMILDTVVEELQRNPDRTFTYVEQAFFARWWRQQTPALQQITKDLVSKGQLSFTNGGWCMHDEAAPHFIDMIDQTTVGHRLLMDNFNFAPRTGWQLDPFGHSATQAALLSAEVGFAGLFFGRIDYQDLHERVEGATAEFIWRASPSLGAETQVFSGLTGSYGGNYGPPDGFNWNIDSNDEPVQDDKNLKDYNVQSRVNDFVNFALWQANHTRGQNIMFTMGSDFQYEGARTWFENLDRIIKHTNEDGRIQAIYSTPEKYLDAKIAETSQSWPLKTDDFFPYAGSPHDFWTGYFTSRPALKRYIRDTSALFQVVKQIGALKGQTVSGTQTLAEEMGVLQHHDAVSGTAKQHVTFDYASRLADGRLKVVAGLSSVLSEVTGLQRESNDGPAFSFCELRNVSVCAPTQGLQDGKELDFILWNGLAQARSELAELPVAAGTYKLVEVDGGAEVPTQTVPSLPSVTNYGANAGGAENTLLFTANVPPLGYKAYRLTKVSSAATPIEVTTPTEDVVIQNELLALQFCDGVLCKITDKKTGLSVAAKQEWFWYKASIGNDESGQASGAYDFRPNSSDAVPINPLKTALSIVQGSLANEAHQHVTSWITQRIRLPAGAAHAEITYTVGEIPVGDWGMEVISRITTDIANAGQSFTDSNGREMIPRMRDYRKSWKFTQTEPVAGNYYPVTTGLFIRDQKAQLTMLTDASQGGTGSVVDGQVELMVHRRLYRDDGKGVGEPLNETQYVRPYVGWNQGQHYGPGLVIRGRHWISVAAPAQAAAQWRPLQDQLYQPLTPFFAADGATIPTGTFTGLAQALPINVQLVSLSQWDTDSVLLRLAHQFGVDEDQTLSQPATVDLATLFAGHQVAEVEERGLGGTITRDEVLKRRVNWKIDGEAHQEQVATKTASMDDTKVTLGPLQIRTFRVKFGKAPASIMM